MKNQDIKINQEAENVSTAKENTAKLEALRDYVIDYRNKLGQNAVKMSGKIIDIISKAVMEDPIRFISEDRVTLTLYRISNDLTELGNYEICASHSTENLPNFSTNTDIISGAQSYCVEALVCALRVANINFRFYIKKMGHSLESVQKDVFESYLLIQLRLTDLNDWES